MSIFHGYLLAALLTSDVTKAAEPPQAVIDAALQIYFDYDYSDPANADAPRPSVDQTAQFVRKGVIRAVNISGQASPDWMIDVQSAPISAWCGTGGCRMQIWSADQNHGYSKVFDKQVLRWKLKSVKGEQRHWLWVDLHGTACDGSGTDACPFGFEWLDDRMVASSRFTRTTLHRTGPLPQSIDFDPSYSEAPAALKSLAVRFEAYCQAHGGRFKAQTSINRTPDLNSDRIADWSFDGANGYCTEATADSSDVNLDPCKALDCTATFFLSQPCQSGTSWRAIPLGTASYTYVIEPRGLRLPLLSNSINSRPVDAPFC